VKLYFAGLTLPTWERNKRLSPSILLSYVEKNKILRFFEKTKEKIFLDSGAFTAFNSGKEINIDEYADFIKKHRARLDVAATLDSIGDYQKTAENTSSLEKKGCEVLPVFHFGSPLSELERLVRKYDYIALGGLVPLALRVKRLRGWLDLCFSKIGGKVRVHGFGINAFWAWRRYPFYSVDATSWVQWGAFKRAVVFEGLLRGFRIVSKADRELKSMICYDDSGESLEDFNIASYHKAAGAITELWEKKGIKWP